ncbi:MAG: ferredoxin [Rhodococcus sp. (in: high G+C Gram-positive bacteria)]|uniref:ferredoxin n=1 Tax=Rhodococcus sp. TaxID=1831 RepID=UPI003BB10981
MKITVDPQRCQGHTMCAANAPDLFVLSDEDGHAQPAVDVVPPHLHDAARRAVDDCPERAISISES